MSFPKSKRFGEVKGCAPPPGAYDPKDLKHTPTAVIDCKSDRWAEKKDDPKYGSDSALEMSGVTVTPKKNLFKAPLPQASGKLPKKDKKKEEFIDPGRIKELEKELKSLASERAHLDKRLVCREEDVTRLEARLQEAHREKSKLTAKVATLERQMSSVNKSNETLKNQLSNTEGTQSKQKALHQELTQLQTDLEKRSKEAKQLREQLEQTKKHADVDVDKTKSALNKLQTDYKTLEKERISAQEEIEKLKKTIQELSDQKLALEKELEELKKELSDLKTQHEGQVTELKESLEVKISSLSEQEQTLNDNIVSLTDKYQALESNLAVEQKERKITEAQLRREASALKLSLADLQESNDQLSSVNAELLDRLSLEKDEVTILEKKLVEAECITNDKFELLTTYLDSKTAEIDTLRQQLQQKQAEMTEISSQLETAKQAARKEVDTARENFNKGMEDMRISLEQKSLEEQDIRWQLERALKQVVEYQELAEVRQEALLAIQAQREEGERETSEEMDIIRHKMEQERAKTRATLNQYKNRVTELETASMSNKEALLQESKERESALNEKIQSLEEAMTAAEKASLEEVEELKRKAKESEEQYQDKIKALQTDMRGCEQAAQQEIAKLRQEMEEGDKSADQEIQTLVSRLSEIRLQNNEVIDELKEQVKEAKKEHAILEESSRRAAEAHKTETLQKDQQLLLTRTELESVRLELDTERADNACNVQRLEEERERDQEMIERDQSRIKELEGQVQGAEGLLSSQVSTLEKALTANTQQMDLLKTQVETAEQSAHEAEAQALDEVEEIKTEMVRAEEVARQQLQQFDEQINALQEQARKEVDDLTKHLEDVRGEADTEINSLRSQIKLRDEEIARLNAHLTDAEQVANSVKDKCGALKKELAQLAKDNETEVLKTETKYKKLLEEQKEEHETALTRRSSEDGAQHHVDIQEMARALQELQEKYDALEQLVGPFQEQLKVFEAEKQMLLGSKTNAEQETSKLSDEYARLLGHQNQKQKIKHVLKLKQENNSLKIDLGKSQEENTRLKRRISKLEGSQRSSEGGRKYDPTKAFSHAKENIRTPPVSPLRQGNRI